MVEAAPNKEACATFRHLRFLVPLAEINDRRLDSTGRNPGGSVDQGRVASIHRAKMI